MKAKLFFTLLALCMCYFAKAQQFNIKGQVYAEKGGNAAYAVISLRSGMDNRFLVGTAADSVGKFTFSKINPGNYMLQVQSVGMALYKQPVELKNADLELSPITLKTDSAKHVLNEVTIAASKPFLRRELDRTVVDIANSVYSKGENAWRLFSEIPQVQTDPMGNISFRGMEAVTVYVDDVKVPLSGQLLANYLKSIPSESIKSYEIFPVGGAQFDASNTGVIINIVLKTEYTYGLSGTVGTEYQYLIPGFSGGNKTGFGNTDNTINLNYTVGKMTFQTSGSLIDGKSFDDEVETRHFNSSNVYSYQNMNSIYKGPYMNYRLAVEYRLRKNQILTANFQHSFSSGHPSATSTNTFSTGQSTVIDSAVNTYTNGTGHGNTSTANIRYRYMLDTIGSKLDIGYNYNGHTLALTQVTTNDYSYPTNEAMDFSDGFSINNPITTTIHSIKANLLKKISRSLSYQVGASDYISRTTNAFTYFSGTAPSVPVDNQRSNTFKYNEHIPAFFGTLTKNWDKWGLLIGMRTEHTSYDGFLVTGNEHIGGNRWDLFPSVFLQNKINKDNSVTLAYSRSITRPPYQQLNPFEIIQNPFSIQAGNPSLVPAFTNKAELSYLLNAKYNFTIGYKEISGQIANVSRNEGPVVVSTWDNADNNSNAYFSAYIPVTILKWWTINSSLTLMYNKLTVNELDFFHDQAKFGQSVQVTNRFDIQKDFYVEVNSYYSRNQFLWLSDWKPQGAIDFNFKKSFLSDKLTVSLGLYDPFDLKKIGYNVQEPGFTRNVTEYIPTRSVIFGLSYAIKKGKKKLNAVETQNNDGQSRL